MMLMDLRVVVSNVLFSVFGYLGPSLNSVKAVVSEDVDSIREYMTYWVVLSIFSCVGMMLHATLVKSVRQLAFNRLEGRVGVHLQAVVITANVGYHQRHLPLLFHGTCAHF